MQDFIVIVVIVGFFGICLAFVAGCDRILGPDVTDTHDHEALDEHPEAPEPARTAS